MKEHRFRIIHVHVPKTAGTALRTAFELQFKDRLRVFPHWDEAKYTGINPDDYDFYSGHIGYETAKGLSGDMVTVLRNPVDRFVSVYYFWRELYERGVEKSLNTELASKYKLDDFARIRDQPSLTQEFSNRCTYQIAYGSSLVQRRELHQKGLTDDEVFRMASSNLAEFSVVGIQEDIARFSTKIQTRFGVKLNVGKINVTTKRPEIDDVPLITRRAIQDLVFIDIELYQIALRLSCLREDRVESL